MPDYTGLTYTSANDKRTFEFDWRETGVSVFGRYGTTDAMRQSEWDYELGYYTLTGAYRKAVTRTIDVFAYDLEELDALDVYAGADMYAETPGEFEYFGWKQAGYVVKIETKQVYGHAVDVTLTLAFIDGVWRKGNSIQLAPIEQTGSDFEHHYPYGYPYGYPLASASRRLPKVNVGTAPVTITVFGPATNPSVNLGGNVYAVDVTIASTSRLIIDGVAGTCYMIDASGYETNCLPYAHLGAGEGSGEYIFERLGIGDSKSITWDGSYGVDVTVWDERGSVPWTS